MKLKSLSITNALSFAARTDIEFSDDITMFIGPNGGGKTNVLEIINAIFRKSLTSRMHVVNNNSRKLFQPFHDVSTITLPRHSFLPNQPQLFELELVVTDSDIANMEIIARNLPTLRQKAEPYYDNLGSLHNNDINQIASVKSGDVIDFQIDLTKDTVGDVDGTKPRGVFYNYLMSYSPYQILSADLNFEPLSATPYLYMPVSRAQSSLGQELTLATFDRHENARRETLTNSRNAPMAAQMAMGGLFTTLRKFQEEGGDPKARFFREPNVEAFSEALAIIGYDWDVRTINQMNNTYAVELTKDGVSFSLGFASSGEKELLNYLFTIYGLAVRGGLVLVDEPEMHLHPRWQNTLRRLLANLSKSTDTQFVMTTHSPSLVTPETIGYVSRVYSDAGSSKVIKFDRTMLPNTKHVFSIVNSYNNEKMFFADFVVLVEGVSDRILFEALLEDKFAKTGKTVEIVPVGGKMMFDNYTKMLDASAVPWAIIADRDYGARAPFDQVASYPAA